MNFSSVSGRDTSKVPDKLIKACKADLGSWKVDFSSAVHVFKRPLRLCKEKKRQVAKVSSTMHSGDVGKAHKYHEAYLAVLSNIIKLYIRRGLSASPFETGWPSWWSSVRPPPPGPGRPWAGGGLTHLPLPPPPPPGFQPRTQQLPD